jgi:hypothetical protein
MRPGRSVRDRELGRARLIISQITPRLQARCWRAIDSGHKATA